MASVVVVITVVAPADYRKDSWTTSASLIAKTCSGTRGGGMIETVTLQLTSRTFLHSSPVFLHTFQKGFVFNLP